MPSKSAGVLAYRTKHDQIEVLLVHPGGPFWRNKDDGAWSIPKGEFSSDEAAELAARREFAEELGIEMTAPLSPLGEVRQRGGKVVEAFAAQFDVDVLTVRSNTFEIEWPPRSGQRQTFPEIDRAEWFDLTTARVKINKAQSALLDRIEAMLESPAGG
jgi:predicted NUDIX family NTP pyrophosphohydrolase